MNLCSVFIGCLIVKFGLSAHEQLVIKQFNPGLEPVKFESFVLDTTEMVSIQYLHWTSSIAQLESTLETMLLARPWYSPQPSFVKFFIVSSFLSSDRRILSLPVGVDPSFFHDIWGSGFPVALQDNVTSSSSLFVTPWGSSVISGDGMQSVWVWFKQEVILSYLVTVSSVLVLLMQNDTIFVEEGRSKCPITSFIDEG